MGDSRSDFITIMKIDNHKYFDFDIANNIFEETINCLIIDGPYDYILSNANRKIYIYSCYEKAILGYVRINEILHGKTYELLKKNRHNGDEYSHVIIKKYGKYNSNCHAFVFQDVTEFDKHMPLNIITLIDNNFKIQRFVEYIFNNSALYNLINEWDKAYGLDGTISHNHQNAQSLILKINKS